MRSGNPRIGDYLSLAQFVGESHVLIEPGGSRYMPVAQQTSTSTLIEQYLAELGLTRRVGVRVPHFLVVPDIVQSTDLIATLPSYVIRHMRSWPGLKSLQMPLEVPRFENCIMQLSMASDRFMTAFGPWERWKCVSPSCSPHGSSAGPSWTWASTLAASVTGAGT